MPNFLTRFVEAIGTSTMKSMLPEVYFMLEGEENVEGTEEVGHVQVDVSETE